MLQMLYVLATTELLGRNVLTDRRPKGEVSKRVTPWGSSVVTSLSPNRASKLHATIHIFQKVVQKGEVGAASTKDSPQSKRRDHFHLTDEDVEEFTRSLSPFCSGNTLGSPRSGLQSLS